MKNLNIFSRKKSSFKFLKLDITNKKELEITFNEFKPSAVVNFAAQAGVRYSIENHLLMFNQI